MSLSQMPLRECFSWSLVLLLSLVLVFQSKTPLTFPDQSGQTAGGNCLCNAEEYCVCTPNLAIDVLIETEASPGSPIVLVRRVDNGKYAMIGGFVQVGESVETTVQRELLEETGLRLEHGSLKLLGIYSDPRRDHRRHTVSAVYSARPVSLADLRPGDDARAAEVVARDALSTLDYAFDHRIIVMDYLTSPHLSADTPRDWARSTCSAVATA